MGEVDCLEKPVSAFIRLIQPVVLGDLTEVPVPTRFVFILLGPMVSTFTFIISHSRYDRLLILLILLRTLF